MTRGNALHALAPIVAAVAAVALAIGGSTASVAVAGPRDGNDRTEVQRPEERDGTTVAPSLVAGETTVAQEEPPTLEFGSAASAEAAAPVGTIEQVEPVIEAPSQEQIDAVQEPLATASLPVDQVGERDSDDDKIPDAIDNCPSVYNIDQSDDDGDGVGNACAQAPEAAPPPETETDTDGDGVPDYGDNCWQLANPTQKDGDGDGLGNGCDEGSAPFLTPNEDEVVEAQRFVEEPTLSTGDPVAPEVEAAPAAPDTGAPVEVTEGATVAAPDERDPDQQQNRGEGTPPEPQSTDQAANATSGANAEGEAASPGGDGAGRVQDQQRPGRDGSGPPQATASDGGPSKVEQGQRPRRNPDLTEESGPVLPPPRSSKRYQLEPGFETVIRIDAGALGSGEADTGQGRPQNHTGGSAGGPATEPGNGKRSDGQNQSSGSGDSGGSGRDQPGDTPPPGSADGQAPRSPVPIEAGAVIENPESDRAEPTRDELGGSKIDRGAGSVLTNTVGWQAGLGQVDPADEEKGDAAPNQEGNGQPKKEEKRDVGKGQGRHDPVEWDRDHLYKGGEATKRDEVVEIAGTNEDDLYLTQRSGTGEDPGSFVYAVPVDADGVYRVRLHFAETLVGADGGIEGKAGERVFDVDVEGETALDGFDIYDEVGSMTAVVKVFDAEVDDGMLELEFVGRKGQPVVSAIEVLRQVGEVPGDAQKT